MEFDLEQEKYKIEDTMYKRFILTDEDERDESSKKRAKLTASKYQ